MAEQDVPVRPQRGHRRDREEQHRAGVHLPRQLGEKAAVVLDVLEHVEHGHDAGAAVVGLAAVGRGAEALDELMFQAFDRLDEAVARVGAALGEEKSPRKPGPAPTSTRSKRPLGQL